jgi:DNA polymerase-3 subunit epsilon
MPEAETIRIHGLRSADLVDAPPLSAVLDELVEALTGRVLVAHVAEIERGFLGAAFELHGLRLVNPVVDTAALAAELFRRRREPVPETTALSSLARALGLPVHRPHHADGDALTTAQVFLALATHLDALEPQTVGSLAGAGARSLGRSTLWRRVARLTKR